MTKELDYIADLERENRLVKSFLYCTTKSCNNCGKVNCENFQRQRVDCCGLWVSYKDYIKQLENKIADIKANCDLAIEGRDIKIKELEKENAELKEQGDKWFVFETDAGNWGMDKATQYTVDRHNYFYGTKEECQKWGVEHKIKDYTGHKYCYDRLEEQLTKAKEILVKLLEEEKNNMYWEMNGSDKSSYYEVRKQAEQFIKEIEK